MRQVVRIVPKRDVTVEIDPRIYDAMRRLEKQEGIPISTQLYKGMKEYVNYYGVHVTNKK
jgi:hypothetical protein